MAASTCMRSLGHRLGQASCTATENSPCSERNAARAASAEPLSMRSAMASACARSSLSLRKARAGEFAGLGHARAELQRAREQHVDDDRPAVTVQLEHVFAGERGRRGEEQREAVVERLPSASRNGAEHCAPRPRHFAENLARDLAAQRAGDADDADAATPGGVASAAIVSRVASTASYVFSCCSAADAAC